jgi:beta-lactam-binding protein with PASTA domain
MEPKPHATHAAGRFPGTAVLSLALVIVPALMVTAQTPPPWPISPTCSAAPPASDSWPIANTDSIGATTGLPIVFPGSMLTANDVGASALTVVSPIDSTPSAGGTITGSDPFTYSPPASAFSGTDVFTYEVTDAAGHKATGLVRVTVSVVAPSVTTVPAVTGATQSAAAATLAGVGLNAAIASANSTSIAIGLVISQAPIAGTSVTIGSAVNLIVSLGALVPNVVGSPQSAASAALTTAGLTTGTVTTANHATVPAGAVISQNPIAGVNAAPGSGVALSVSLGPVVVSNVVPNVVGQPRAAATTAITTAGLTAGTVTFANHATIAAGSIVSTAPVAGTALAPGGAVNMVVSLGSDGLVVAFGFDEAAGLVANDSSPVAKSGTIRGALHVPGKFGGALQFDGIDDWVTMADVTSSPIDLTGGMTLEAWVNPTAQADWDTIILKERGAGLSYALYAYDGAPQPGGTNLPTGYLNTAAGLDVAARGLAPLPLNTWTHLATTYDGSTQRFFVNGVQVASRAQTGNIAVANGALRIGGNTAFVNEFYKGLIDEVRIYNRARTAAQITSDMNTPIVR